MSHERFADRLLEHAYGELSPREAREMEAHAAACAECRTELARVRATRRIMGALPEERAPEAGERILLAAAREAARDRAPVRILPAWIWSASALAALFLAVGALSYRLLALRPAAERQGEELLGHGQYAEAPPAPAAAASGEASATSGAAAPAEAPAPVRPPPRRAEPTPPAKSRVRAPAAREEVARAAPAAG
ncbi:zf-HC2 domain-containing protein, partial [Anaeromyxobacter terrae]|uniref:zf-HC2 domain-containing protein n=1 Tax=Anaeromyxobacter terrae TaxID=2925406 RepID=UPI001F56529E